MKLSKIHQGGPYYRNKKLSPFLNHYLENIAILQAFTLRNFEFDTWSYRRVQIEKKDIKFINWPYEIVKPVFLRDWSSKQGD